MHAGGVTLFMAGGETSTKTYRRARKEHDRMESAKQKSLKSKTEAYFAACDATAAARYAEKRKCNDPPDTVYACGPERAPRHTAGRNPREKPKRGRRTGVCAVCGCAPPDWAIHRRACAAWRTSIQRCREVARRTRHRRKTAAGRGGEQNRNRTGGQGRMERVTWNSY